MKKVLYILAVVLLAGFAACSSAEDQAAAEAEATEAIDNMTDMLDESEAEESTEGNMAEHVCNADCNDQGCSFKHGEKGHTCSDACAAMGEGDEAAGDESTEG